ncbi:SRPBCC family protein [Ferruginibacter yonginensis]|uniref:SRPBCC family protein n=1 Tax=Ferruginibacter yonginensis TaxID=1310416 RepID=A0ABV8QVE2_9BACT
MKLLKGVLLVFAGLFVFITLISLLIPSKIAITRAVSIKGDSAQIFKQIADVIQWKNWHPVFADATINATYSNTPGTVGSTISWVTNGKQNTLVVEKIAYPIVSLSLQRSGEKSIDNILSVTPVQEQGDYQVQWQSTTHLKWYPWDKFSGIFVEKLTGAGYEDALNALKKYIETPNKVN